MSLQTRPTVPPPGKGMNGGAISLPVALILVASDWFCAPTGGATQSNIGEDKQAKLTPRRRTCLIVITYL
jgi:hypothetical protein